MQLRTKAGEASTEAPIEWPRAGGKDMERVGNPVRPMVVVVSMGSSCHGALLSESALRRPSSWEQNHGRGHLGDHVCCNMSAMIALHGLIIASDCMQLGRE